MKKDCLVLLFILVGSLPQQCFSARKHHKKEFTKQKFFLQTIINETIKNRHNTTEDLDDIDDFGIETPIEIIYKKNTNYENIYAHYENIYKLYRYIFKNCANNQTEHNSTTNNTFTNTSQRYKKSEKPKNTKHLKKIWYFESLIDEQPVHKKTKRLARLKKLQYKKLHYFE